MAAIKNLVILNPADKTRFYSVASGEGAPADVTDELIVNVKDFPSDRNIPMSVARSSTSAWRRTRLSPIGWL